MIYVLLLLVLFIFSGRLYRRIISESTGPIFDKNLGYMEGAINPTLIFVVDPGKLPLQPILEA